MEENAEIWELWQAVGTQWRVGGMGGAIGMDYPAVFEIAEKIEIVIGKVEYSKLRVLERAVLAKQAKAMEDQKEKTGK